MNFYTNVQVQGSYILLREINDGIRSLRKIQWKPTLYLKDKHGSDHTSLYGDRVKPVQPGTIRDCRDFVKKYDSVEGMEIFGQLNYSLQFMNEYPMDGWDIKKIRCVSIDIETGMPPGKNEFPKPEKAEGMIQLITVQDMSNKMCFTFGLKEFDNSAKITNYVHCRGEEELIRMFLLFWEKLQPDIITGWNVNGFDVPYLINRISKVAGPDATKRLSPWGSVSFEMRQYKGKDEIKCEILGVAVLDYMELIKKFIPVGRESWSLGSVAQEELGTTKLKNPGTSFTDFYENYYQTFVEYNIKDAQLVTMLDEKMRMIELALATAYKAKVNYEDIYSPVKTWDAIIHNELLRDKIVVPQRQSTGLSDHQIVGAYVKEPVPGMYKDVISVDATSLYPSIMMTLNTSPETYLGECYSTVEECLLGNFKNKDQNVVMGANGALYDKTKRGFIPNLVERYMADRKKAKTEMLRLEQLAEETPGLDLGNKIAALRNEEQSIKVLLNSLYGGTANKGFRFFNPTVAESITTTGQLFLMAIEKNIDIKLSEHFKVPGKYLVYIDTDSVYLSLEKIVDRYAKDASTDERIRIIEKITVDHVQRIIGDIVDEVYSGLNVYENKIRFKQEIASDKTLFSGKKKYICRVHSSEGVRYAKPKFKVKGLELVRSSTPKVIQQTLKDSLHVIFDGNEADTQEFIQSVKSKFLKMSINEIAFPRGANNLLEYSDSNSIYSKGCPIAVRGSLLYNNLIKKLDIGDRYPLVEEGNKVKFVYLKVPNTLHENIIAWPGDGKLPVEFKLHQYIDYETQFQKTFVDAISNIIEPIGWSAEKVADLSDFFG